MRHRTVAVLGASGFIGAYVVNALVQEGKRVLVATRRRQNAAHLTLLPVDVIEADVHEPGALERLVNDVDAVINLVGILHSRRGAPYGPDFAKVHVELPKQLVAACVARQVRRVLHVSALGADSRGPSMYLRSKGDGEAAVLASPLLATTVFRPSVVFGPEDRFLNTFASLQSMFPVIPLACAHAKFQPVYVRDVAQAIVNALDLDTTIGKAYELAGPNVYTLEQLVRFVGETLGRPSRIVRLPPALARLQAAVFEHLPGEPLITRDNLDSMSVDNIASGPIAPELGVEPASVEAIAPLYLSGATREARFRAMRMTTRR
jgi:NADH dehydrogenase